MKVISLPDHSGRVAIISGQDGSLRTSTSITAREDQTPYSDLIWSLKRLDVRSLIALPQECVALQKAYANLSPPPDLPQHSEDLMIKMTQDRLQSQRQDKLLHPNRLLPPRSEHIMIIPPPKTPFALDGLKLCFHDELIGADDALLIHYGPSRFEVSGYHPPISSLSIPLGQELSAYILMRATVRNVAQSEVEHIPNKRETVVIQINAQGERLKGPWYPRLNGRRSSES